MNEAIKKLFIGPDTIFAGDVKLLNANIFDTTDISQVSDITNMVVDENTGSLSVTETVTTLSNAVSPGYKMIVKIREAIASTYTALRDVCGYIMLAGLIFTGIKILLGSNIPSKNTRWLEALQDWLIGMALLIFSHIIMIGIFTVSDTLCDGLSGSLYGIGSINFTLISQCLLSWDSAEQIIYLIMLGYLIYLTVVFIVAYFKRLLWICVLIVIAPIVSVMYAFGHETKRIYTSWLREYIMSVLVQPFHLIVYYILVSIPLNMVNSTGQFDLTSNGFEIIYALGAMSFIRPAEKYIRQLFGMDKGIANMASFDSGKQTIDAAKKAVEDFGKKLVGVVKTAAVVVASIYTGGAAGAAAGAAGGAGAATAGGTAIGAGASGAAGSSAAGGMLTSGAAEGVAGGAEGLVGAEGMGSLGEGAGNLLDFGTTGPMQEDPSFSFSPSSMGGAMEDFPEEDPLRLSRRESLEEQIADGQISESDLSREDRELLGLEDKLDSTEDAGEELSQVSEDLKEASEELKDGTMSANNVTITANNVNMQGDIENIETDEIKTVDGEEQGEDSTDDDNGNDGDPKKEDDIDIIEPVDLFGALRNVGFGEDLRDLGNEAYKGINSVRDTFYVTPPPQDWKDKAGREDARIKEKREKRKEETAKQEKAFVKDTGNKQFMFENMEIDGEPILDYYKKMYRGKSDEYIRDKAEERIERELEKMKGYAKYGMDAKQAYPIYQLEKKYGYSTEEAIRAHAGYERFNHDPENIAHISKAYNIKIDSVSEAIPDAQKYYHNGYSNIEDMRWVDSMAAKLDRTPDYAMDIDRALRRRGGKIKYNGENDELKDVIDQINQHYGK